MKRTISAILLLSVCGFAFASNQAHYNDARSCQGTAQSNHNNKKATFTASAGEFAPNHFALVDTALNYSFLSPEMSRDPVTGGYVGYKDHAVYRANYLPDRDIFEIISTDNTFTAVCYR